MLEDLGLENLDTIEMIISNLRYETLNEIVISFPNKRHESMVDILSLMAAASMEPPSDFFPDYDIDGMPPFKL